MNVSAQYRDRDPTNRAAYDPRPQYPRLANGQYDPRELTFNRLSHHFGEAKIEDFNLLVNAGTPLRGGTMEWYGFATYGERDGRTEGFYRQASDARTVTAIHPDGFLAQVLIDLTDMSGATGLRGDAWNWNYDASVNFGRNAVDFVTANSNNASMGAASPTRFDAGGLRYQQYSANLDFQREVDAPLLPEPLSVAFGLEYRGERFEVEAGEPASYLQGPVRLPNGQLAAAGAQVFPGFRPDNATTRDRHSTSLYLDLETDLTAALERDTRRPRRGLLRLRLRCELQAGDALPSVRWLWPCGAAYRRAFARPRCINSSSPPPRPTTSPAASSMSARSRSPMARHAALGAKDLDPETSLNLSAGIVFDLIERLSLTLDYYRIDIDDRIVLTENLGHQRHAGPERSRASGARGRRIYLHLERTILHQRARYTHARCRRGRDVSSARASPAADLGFTAGYNYTKTEIERFIKELGPLAQIPGLELFGRLESERIESGQPRSKLTLSVDWNRGPFGMTLRTNRYGQVFAPGVDPRDDLTIESAWVTDLETALRPAPRADRAGRRQCVRRVSDALSRRPAPGRAGRQLLGEQLHPAVLRIRAVRLQRPVRLRPLHLPLRSLNSVTATRSRAC